MQPSTHGALSLFRLAVGCLLFLLAACPSDPVDPGSQDGAQDAQDVAVPDTAVGDIGTDTTPQPDTNSNACDQPLTSTWQAVEQLFVQNSCTNALCHSTDSAQGGLVLDQNAHENLVSVDATSPLAEPLKRVFAGNQHASLLYLKLEALTLGTELPTGGGAPMPNGGVAISTDELELLRLWIRAGAPKEGVVAGTQELMPGCDIEGEPGPAKIPPLEPPPLGEGVQFYAPPQFLATASEWEQCFATYYDFTQTPGLVPDWAKMTCLNNTGQPGAECLAFNEILLVQDPQSHHSIIDLYYGSATPDNPAWGQWTCHGGDLAGTPCDPTQIGVPAGSGGAECGDRSACAAAALKGVGCIGYGPSDLNQQSTTFGGAQSPVSGGKLAAGVYRTVPLRGYVIWNSHAFNITPLDTTLEQYQNLIFAKPEERLYPARRIFDTRYIFQMTVPAFETRELCASYTVPQGTQLTELSAHTHRFGSLFRTWLPPNDPDCTPAGGCLPNDGVEPVYVSKLYNDPLYLQFDPPLSFNDSDLASRTLKYCATFDNGATDMTTVKRYSQSPPPSHFLAPGGPCAPSSRRCIGGPQHGAICGSDASVCDSAPGAGDGDCDACELRGGTTTADEMYILLGQFYIPN